MINVDISNLWTCLSLPQLLGTEQEIFDAHNLLRTNQPDGPDFLGWLGLPDSIMGRQIHAIRRAGDRIRETSDMLLVCGSGSIWRGARAGVELWGSRYGLDIRFIGDTVSSRQWLDLTKLVERRDVSLHIISDDGQAIGPNVASRGLRWLMERKYGPKAKERISVATLVGSPLHRMGQEEGYELFPLPTQLGGTCSALSAAALIPMAAACLDPVDLLDGACEAWREMDVRSFENPAWLYAAARHALREQGRDREILCYTDKTLESFGKWWQQHAWRHDCGVWPEPILLPDSLRSLDRLVQDSAPIFETMVWFEADPRKVPVEMDWKDYDGLGFLSGKTLDFVEDTLRQSLILSHNDRGIPVVEVQCGEMTEAAVGQLLYLFELTSALTGAMKGALPQPTLSSPSALAVLEALRES